MKTRLITSASGVLLAATFATAEDAPKLVPRPVPGLFDALRAEKSANEDALALLEAAAYNRPPPPIRGSEVPAADTSSEESSSSDADAAAAVPAPAPPPMPAPAPAPGAGSGAEVNARARILFIHRRATLPPELTADLAKPGPVKAGQTSTTVQVVPTRPGKVRIIPKAEVAASLAPAPPPKPSAP